MQTVPLFVLLFLFSLWAVPSLCVGVGQCVSVYIYMAACTGVIKKKIFNGKKNGGGRDGESEIEHHWDW